MARAAATIGELRGLIAKLGKELERSPGRGAPPAGPQPAESVLSAPASAEDAPSAEELAKAIAAASERAGAGA